MKRKLISIVLLIAVMLIVSNCSNNSKENLILGTAATLPPFTHLGGESGNEPIGFDIELAKIIAKDMGRELEIQVIPFQELLTAVENGEIDMAISYIGITEERKNIVDFSDAYFYDATIPLIKKNDLDKFRGVNSTEALAAANKMAVMRNSIQEKYVLEAAGDNEVLLVDVLLVDTLDIGVEALLNDEVDSVIMNTLSARNYTKEYKELMILQGVEFLRVSCGVVVKKGERKFLDDINKIIKRLIGSGEYNKMLEEHVY